MNNYCEKLNRNCKYLDICNSNNFNSNKNYSTIFNPQNIENILLDIWIRKVRKIEWLKLNDLSNLISKYKDQYAYWIYTFNDSNNIIWQNINNKFFIFLISKNNKFINKFIYFDHSNKSIDRVIATWLLLWYPKCCTTTHFNNISSTEDAIEVDKNFDKNIYKDWIKCKLLNPYVKLYVHIPCSNSCLDTIYFSEKILMDLESKYWYDIVNYFFNEVNKWSKK